MRLSGWSLPLEVLSASSITVAIQCPEQFRLKYLKKQRERMYPDRFIGLVDHSVHEQNFKWKMDVGKDMTPELMSKLHESEWARLEEKEDPDWDGEDPIDLQALSLQMVHAYHEIVSPRVLPVAVEQRFEERLPGVPVPIVGYVDVLTKDVIVERKTAGQKVSKPKPRWRFQGRVYSMIADLPTEWHVVTKQKTTAIYTPEDSPQLGPPKPNADATLRMIQQAAIKVNELYARYGREQPWPTDGTFADWLCDYCQFGPKRLGSCIAWRA